MIAIDGPAGSGKSTVAKMLAARLGYAYVETGAMYRALALLALETGTDLNNATVLADLAASADIRFAPHPSGDILLLNRRDVTEAVRTPEVSEASSLVSVHPQVRRQMVERQRALGGRGGVVMEGRDIGTQVFPQADLKIFLDASPEVRTERRFRDQQVMGQTNMAQVREEIEERDRRDQVREDSPLTPAEDSIRIDSTHFSVEQVVEQILHLAQERIVATHSKRSQQRG